MSTNTTLAQVIYAESKDSKIQAIKMLRERSGLGLKEAKDVIDAAMLDTWDSAVQRIAAALTGPNYSDNGRIYMTVECDVRAANNFRIGLVNADHEMVKITDNNGSEVRFFMENIDQVIEALVSAKYALNPVGPAVA